MRDGGLEKRTDLSKHTQPERSAQPGPTAEVHRAVRSSSKPERLNNSICCLGRWGGQALIPTKAPAESSDGRPPLLPHAGLRTWDSRAWQFLTSAVGALVRAIDTVLDPIAEAGHGDTQLSAQAIVLIRLASLGLTLWTWRQMECLAWSSAAYADWLASCSRWFVGVGTNWDWGFTHLRILDLKKL
jgi:hypothetical protein